MSCLGSEEECKCDCHTLPKGMMKHIIPCCSQCPVCYKNIRSGRMKEHMAHHPIHETVFSVPLSMEKTGRSVLDHGEAKWLARQHPESNLAKCYLELHAKVFGGNNENTDIPAVSSAAGDVNADQLREH